MNGNPTQQGAIMTVKIYYSFYYALNTEVLCTYHLILSTNLEDRQYRVYCIVYRGATDELSYKRSYW